MLGCAPAIAKWFLEQQFYDNSVTGEKMTWDNHAPKGWHVDHIVPLSLFDLRDSVQQKKAFHVSNLQPLWAKENLSKGAKKSASHADGRYLLEVVAGLRA